ncbi:hypothetical protein [Desulforamulus putei]|uniref:hypothetical protein n=1 Tax=Desulforamulus putei TaxID=74701 RepID=UPI00093375A1|nr:hypothetical protein [Desulforamulus putei]
MPSIITELSENIQIQTRINAFFKRFDASERLGQVVEEADAWIKKYPIKGLFRGRFSDKVLSGRC